MHELFTVNIDNYIIVQLVYWLRKCRTAIKRSDKAIYQEDYNRYANAVFEFCEEWKSYAKLHWNTYNSNAFRQAVKLAVLPRATYIFVIGNDGEIIATEDFEYLQMQNTTSFNLISKSIDRETDRVKYYEKLLQDLLYGSREALHTIINYLSLSTFTYKINILEKEKDLSSKSVKQIISQVKRGKWQTIERKITPEKNKTLSDYLIATIRDNQINKNIFYPYVKNKEDDKKRVYSKPFFVNVGFFLGLVDKEVEQLLRNEGYTIQYSKREDDGIMSDCFKYYFSQEYASALLFKAGYDTLEIGK